MNSSTPDTCKEGIKLLEAALEFFEALENGRYTLIIKILHAALIAARLL